MTYGLWLATCIYCGLWMICSLYFYFGIYNGNELTNSYHLLPRPLSLFSLSSALRPVAMNDLFNHNIIFTMKGNADIRDVVDEKQTITDIMPKLESNLHTAEKCC